jgi:hypothetical protein
MNESNKTYKIIAKYKVCNAEYGKKDYVKTKNFNFKTLEDANAFPSQEDKIIKIVVGHGVYDYGRLEEFSIFEKSSILKHIGTKNIELI